ncbi:MAG: sugar phosphate isomerase/epimerase [Clostridia bacterium]|nr:sugar phosphate isomerase/epimerase [Clostridia bacterium]
MTKLGACIVWKENTLDFAEKFAELKEIGLDCCQITVWDPTFLTDENAKKINEAAASVGFEVTCLWVGWTGPCEWNFTAGPDTIGLVPRAYRAHRLKELIEGSLFAEKIGVKDIATHVGFIPENPSDTNYNELVASIRWLCNDLKKRGQNFLFETGQETPVTMLRTIEDLGVDNAFINFDTANIMLYGKGNPTDSVRIFGKYVRNTHIKDGFYPTDGKHLGAQVRIGEGRVDFGSIFSVLSDCEYPGPYIIEREISGPQQKIDIMDAIAYIRKVMRVV